MNRRVLFLYPPHTRNTEPPLGAALLAALLRSCGAEARVLDLNAGAAPALALSAPDAPDARTHRAVLHVGDSVLALQGPAGYASPSRYRTHVAHYAAALRACSRGEPWELTPGDFTDRRCPDFDAAHIAAFIDEPERVPFHSRFAEVVGPVLRAFDPDTVGISVVFRSQLLPAAALGGWVRRERPGAAVMLGGGFLDALPDEACAMLARRLGAVVRGDGEPALCEAFGLAPPEPGLFRDPDFGDLDLDAYFAPGRVLPLATSRGCYWRRCAFCDEGRRAFAMDRPRALAARLARLAAAHAPACFHFTDNAIPPACLRVLAEEGSPAPWFGFVRARPELEDAGFVRALAASGCRMLQLGLETPVPRLLAALRKGVDPEGYGPILRNCADAGIRSYVYLMFGLPGQTPEDCEAALDLVASQPIDFLNASIFRLPPGAAMSANPEAWAIGAFKEDRGPGLYHEWAADGMDLRQVRRWLAQRFKRHAHARAALARTPPFFKSNHAVFF